MHQEDIDSGPLPSRKRVGKALPDTAHGGGGSWKIRCNTTAWIAEQRISLLTDSDGAMGASMGVEG